MFVVGLSVAPRCAEPSDSADPSPRLPRDHRTLGLGPSYECRAGSRGRLARLVPSRGGGCCLPCNGRGACSTSERVGDTTEVGLEGQPRSSLCRDKLRIGMNGESGVRAGLNPEKANRQQRVPAGGAAACAAGALDSAFAPRVQPDSPPIAAVLVSAADSQDHLVTGVAHAALHARKPYTCRRLEAADVACQCGAEIIVCVRTKCLTGT